jgi:penicillin amidase
LTDSNLLNAPTYDPNIYLTENTFPNAITHYDTNYVVGSNNWVVHASKSATGNAFLCNDTHLGLRLPSTWYEIAVVSGDRKRRGLSIPGAPFIVSGFNEFTAWGMTNATWDLTDFYHLDLNDAGDAYELDGEYEKLEPFVEKFAVKGGDTIAYTYYKSYFGPVDTIHGEFLATQWVAEVPSNDGRAFFELQQSTNIEDAFHAVHYFMQPTQNFVLADNAGNVGLATSGLALRNRAGKRGIINGNRKSVKSDYYPTHDILNSFNPDRGWVASANQQHIAGDASRLLSTRYAPTSRGRRIAQMMENQEIIDRNYLHQMHIDVVDLEWEWMSEKILNLLDTEWKVRMTRWDGKCDTSSSEAAFFIVYKEWVEQIFESEFNSEIAMYPQEEHMMYLLMEYDTLPTTSGILVSEDILRRAVDSTFQQLTDELGDDVSKWTYGQVHKTTVRHITGLEPLGLEAFGSMGSNRTVNVAGGFPTTHGPSMRTVIELTPDGPVAELMITGGQSGRPNSANYADQIDHFRSGEYHSAPLDTGFNGNNYSAIIQFTAP